MSLSVTVTPNETFPDDSNVTRAMLRNAASPTVAVSGSVSNSDLASGAAVALEKLVGVTEGQILVGGLVAHASGGSNKKIAAVTPSSNASVTAGGEITPSDLTITKAKLEKSDANNIINGQDELTNVASGDSVLLYDASATSGDRLKKATVSNLLNAGVSSTSQDVTTHTTVSATGSVTIDLSANPVQVVEINTSGITVTFNVSNAPADATTAANVQIRIKATFASSTATLAFSGSPGWTFLKTAPTTIAAQKDAILAVTAFNDTVIAGYSVEA